MKEIIEKLERISEMLRYYEEKGKRYGSYAIGQMEQREGILFALKAMGYNAAENNGKWEITKA